MRRSQCVCVVLLLLGVAQTQNVDFGHPTEIQAQHQPTPAEMQARLRGAQVQKDAKELSELSSSLPADMEAIRQGALPKDMAEKLKKLEKLSKRLREELSR
jgi:hypothetical protein